MGKTITTQFSAAFQSRQAEKSKKTKTLQTGEHWFG